MQIPEHTYTATTEGYRFGFNGYENEPDIAGQGSVIDFGARIYDARLGSFFSVGPIWIKNHHGMGIDPPKITGKEKDGEVSADSKWIFFASPNNPNSKSTRLKVSTEKEVDDLYGNISKAMKKAKRNGAGEGVSNLSRLFNGVGETKKESKKWLMRRLSYAEGITENIAQFKEQINSSGVSLEVLAESLKDGETKNFSDYWEYMADPSGSQYGVTGGAKRDAIFYYSYGASTITSKGNFNLTRDGNTVTITGQITQKPSTYVKGYLIIIL